MPSRSAARMRCLLKWARPPCLTHINGALLCTSLYRGGANEAAAHYPQLTGRGMAVRGVFANVRARDGVSAFA